MLRSPYINGSGVPRGGIDPSHYIGLKYGGTIASAANLVIPDTGDYFKVTGSTGITSIDCSDPNRHFYLQFIGTPEITHSASLFLITANDITIEANDIAEFHYDLDGKANMLGFDRADGTALVGGAGGGDMETSTYDPTNVNDDVFDMANMVEAANAKVLTSAERTRLTSLGSARVYQLAFENVGTTASGTITPPTGSTIVIDRFPGGADGIACLAGADARPNWEASYTAGGALVTATLATNGDWTLSDTPAADTCICYVISVAPESVTAGAAIVPGVAFGEDHALTHVNGVDDIQSATNAQKGLATAAQITALEANTSHAGATNNPHATDIENLGAGTLAELNDAVSDATLIDTGDSRLTDARTPTDNSVTLAKLAHGTAGNLYTFDAAGAPVAVATGTDGQVLTSGGAGTAPAFEDATGGGGLASDVQLRRAASMLPIAADFAPLNKLTGDANSILRLMAEYDETTSQGLRDEFKAPSDLDTSGDVTFFLEVGADYDGVGEKGVQWVVKTLSKASSETWDTAIGSWVTAVDTEQTVVADDKIEKTKFLSVDVAVSTLGLAASDVMLADWIRDVADANDDLADKSYLGMVGVIFPRA